VHRVKNRKKKSLEKDKNSWKKVELVPRLGRKSGTSESTQKSGAKGIEQSHNQCPQPKPGRRVSPIEVA
jgi:hypothetical protein